MTKNKQRVCVSALIQFLLLLNECYISVYPIPDINCRKMIIKIIKKCKLLVIDIIKYTFFFSHKNSCEYDNIIRIKIEIETEFSQGLGTWLNRRYLFIHFSAYKKVSFKRFSCQEFPLICFYRNLIRKIIAIWLTQHRDSVVAIRVKEEEENQRKKLNEMWSPLGIQVVFQKADAFLKFSFIFLLLAAKSPSTLLLTNFW